MTRVEDETDPLLAPPPAFGLAEAGRIAETVFGLAGALTPLPSERDQNFRVDDGRGRSFLLKLQNPADDAAVVDMQTLALLHVAAEDPDLPVMRVVPARTGEHWTEIRAPDGRLSRARMFTFLEGHNPVAGELDERSLFEWGATVARLGMALRGFTHPAGDYEILWDIRRAPRLRALAAHVPDDGRRQVVEEVLDRYDAKAARALEALRSQVVHNDMSPDNVLVDGNGRITGITDFGDMTRTALVCDLAVALADVLDGRPDALEVAGALIEGYRSVTPLQEGEAAVLGDLVATRCAAAMVISAWRLSLYPENEAYVSTFGDGSWRLLQILAAEGFDAVGRHLADLCLGEVPGSGRPADRLLERRRGVLGPAPLSYRRPVHLVRGEGVWVYDDAGRRYLDAYNNVAVVGHAHRGVADAVNAQLRLLNTNTRYLHRSVIELGERLVSTMPAGLDRVLFLNSGSEANDVAWRIASWVTGRRGALVSRFAYHGITEATASLSPEEWRPGDARPGHVELFEPPDGYRGRDRREEPGWAERSAARVEKAATALAGRSMPLAAMFVDSAFTSDGILCPPPEYLRAAAGAVHEAGGLLVADEVQAGHGRFGDVLWSFHASGIEPDIVTMGKPMGNGFPVAAVVARAELVDHFAERTGFFSTFGGNPVASAAALAVLDAIDGEDLRPSVVDVGGYLRARLVELGERHDAIGDVRGRGLLVGVDLVRDRATRDPARARADAVVNGLREEGVLIGATGPSENVLKIRPPLVFAREHADVLVDALDRVLAAT